MSDRAFGGTRRPRSRRAVPLERLEARRLLSAAVQTNLEGMHLVGCACALCGGGNEPFYEQPLTAAEKRALHGEDRLSPDPITRVPPPAANAPRLRTNAIPGPAMLDSTPGAPVGQQPQGALSGRILYTAAGHGFTAANTTTGNFTTQRPLTHSMVEDFGNLDQMTQFVHYAWNAGATIVPTRPVGFQPNEVVIDNPQATFSGGWSDGGVGGPGFTVTFFSTSGPGVASRYRFATASATETAVARYTPNIPQAGFYPVYTWVPNGSNRLPDQLYRITHTGGKTEVKVDHQKVGKGWVYLGTYFFDAGDQGFVEISNKSSFSGAVIADAIRFGNGVGDISRGGGVSGQIREDEASLYWIQKQAENTYEIINNGPITSLPASVYRGSNSTDLNANVGAPPRWAAYMNNSAAGVMTDRLFLSYHSNASSGNSRGTIGLFNGNNNPATKTPFQREWAMYVAKEVNDDLVALSSQLEFPWFNRTGNSLVLDRSDIEFGEINNLSINNQFDATILEVAYHDNATDAALMRDPKVRQWVARSSVQAAVRYFNDATIAGSNAGPLAFAPDAPTNVRAITQSNGNVMLRWDPPVPAAGTGAAATGYRIEASSNGYGFDGGIVVPGGGSNSYTIPAALLSTDATFFRIVSTNAGGWSPPSEVVGARPDPAGPARVLVVNGFDRFERRLNPIQTAPINGPGTSATLERVRPRNSNSFDYIVQAGHAIQAYSAITLGFDSAQNETVINGQVNLSNYAAVIWLSGEESTADRTFNLTEQALVTNYINNGGSLFVSGSELGWDLVANNNGASFFTNVLRANYVSDSANTYNATGAAGSIFAGLSLSFDNGAQFYDVNSADRLSAINGSIIAMNYVGGLGGGAATQWAGANGAKTVVMGFPFETITTAANRAAVMGRVLDFFGLDPASPVPAVPVLHSGSDTGVSNSDGITRLNNSSPASTLDFIVAGTQAGALVKVYSGTTLIGSAIATGPSTTVTTDGVTTLPDGQRLITATQTISGMPESTASAPVLITIDTVAPTIVASAFFFVRTHSLEFLFSENVGPTLSVEDLLVENLTTGNTLDGATLAVAYDGFDNLAVLTFPGQPLKIVPDGNYLARILAADVTDLAGNPLAVNHELGFFFLNGDANRDAAVNLADFNILAANFGQSNRDFTQGDFNYDGVVNLQDFNILASRFGTTLAPSTSIQTSGSTSSAATPSASQRLIDELEI